MARVAFSQPARPASGLKHPLRLCNRIARPGACMIRALAVPVVAFLVLAMAASSAKIATADNTYTVQDGDTLLAVAGKLGIPTNQMLDWAASIVTLNGLGDADSIKPGQVLKLPSS